MQLYRHFALSHPPHTWSVYDPWRRQTCIFAGNFALSHPHTCMVSVRPVAETDMQLCRHFALSHTPTWSVLNPWRRQTCNCAGILLCHTPTHGHLVSVRPLDETDMQLCRHFALSHTPTWSLGQENMHCPHDI